MPPTLGWAYCAIAKLGGWNDTKEQVKRAGQQCGKDGTITRKVRRL